MMIKSVSPPQIYVLLSWRAASAAAVWGAAYSVVNLSCCQTAWLASWTEAQGWACMTTSARRTCDEADGRVSPQLPARRH